MIVAHSDVVDEDTNIEILGLGLQSGLRVPVHREVDVHHLGLDVKLLLDLLGDGGELVQAPADQHEVEALLGELLREPLADPVRGAGDHGPGAEAGRRHAGRRVPRHQGQQLQRRGGGPVALST